MEQGQDERFEFNFETKGETILASGTVGSKVTAHQLAEAVRIARPEMTVVNKGLVIDQSVVEPNIDALKSLIVEVGLSVSNSHFGFNSERILVEGETDSQVATSVISLKMKSFLDKRYAVNRICIVPQNDLPAIPLLLSTGERKSGGIDLDREISAEELFQIPGMNFTKISGFIRTLEDFDALEGGFAIVNSSQNSFGIGSKGTQSYLDDAALRAKALALVRSERESAVLLSESSHVDVATEVTISGDPYQQIDVVKFGRASFLLDSTQATTILDLSQRLSKPDLSGKTILLRPTLPVVGAVAFNDWLARRRAEELHNKLAANGIRSQFVTEIVPSGEGIDGGVAVLIKGSGATSSSATSQ
ncbi:MAG: hypothetical protein AAF226_18300, partial [Verrucomicrobiota bacterium]